jgi:glucose/arabinose dehydrogenase
LERGAAPRRSLRLHSEDGIVRDAWRGSTIGILLAIAAGCAGEARLDVADGTGPKPELPAPQSGLFPVVNVAPAVGWPAGETPRPAAGLKVDRFAVDLEHPRWLYVLPNGDVLVAETAAPPRPKDGDGLKGWAMGFFMKKAGSAVPSADRITLLRDADGDGVVEERSVFLSDLRSPFGMTLVGRDFYVANTDALLRFRYEDGARSIESSAEVVTPLPGGELNHHWTKNVIASQDGSRLFVTVGSNSNVAENGLDKEANRAAILEIDPRSGSTRVYASGLRNPNGLAWEPQQDVLWTVVNERDEIGGDLVPDFLTSVTEGGFYGWPYSYYGDHVDERVQPPNPDLVERAIVPDYALGPHTASLGLAWAGEATLGAPFDRGMFIGQHGSWNRRPHSGYKVIFVPFEAGRPAGMPRDVLTEFLDREGRARGRPVGVVIDATGALLIADDVGNTVWRVSAERDPDATRP